MRRNLLHFFLAVSLIFALVSCASFPKNPDLTHYDPAQGYRFDNLKPGHNNTDSLFVIVAFSGGGTRAASFSYGVLEALRDTEIKWKGEKKRLLDEVDIISSVSGGSFTAAYFVLYRDRIFEGSYERNFLKKDIQQTLFYELLSPGNWFKLAGASYGRSDLAAEYYHSHIFGESTFRKLIDKSTRPFLMLNATDMTTGSQFPFIQDQFDLICSDLADLPVARAVAASSAFPGLLTPLTFKNYAGECQYHEPRWVGFGFNDRDIAPERANHAEDRRSYYMRQEWESKRNFIHLIDGGVADNLGLRAILFAMETSDPAYSIQRRINQKSIEKLVIIVVNAATDPQSERDLKPSVPSLVDVLTTAATVPLDNYSFDTVNRVSSVVKEYDQSVQIRKRCNQILQDVAGTNLKGGNLYAVDLYLTHVTFDYIDDPEKRFQFKNLPTTFFLSSETVDSLKDMGQELLRHDKEFKRLLQELH